MVLFILFSLHAEKHGKDLRALPKGMYRCRSLLFTLIVLPKLARSFVGPSASVLSRAHRTTQRYSKNLFSFVTNAVLRRTQNVEKKCKLLATSQSFWMIYIMKRYSSSSIIMNLYLFQGRSSGECGEIVIGYNCQNPGLPFPSVQTRHQVPHGWFKDNAALFPVINLETLPLLGP